MAFCNLLIGRKNNSLKKKAFKKITITVVKEFRSGLRVKALKSPAANIRNSIVMALRPHGMQDLEVVLALLS